MNGSERHKDKFELVCFLSICGLEGSAGVNFINVLRATFSYKIMAPKITKPNIIREKLLNLLWYEKPARKMLMKLTQGLAILKIQFICRPKNVK